MARPWRVSIAMKNRARELRNNSTREEAILWAYLKDRQLSGAYFRRQVPFGGYVVDFYCATARLAIEIDGSLHERQQIYDQERTKWLEEEKGICVLRFSNSDVKDNLPQVLNEIAKVLKTDETDKKG